MRAAGTLILWALWSVVVFAAEILAAVGTLYTRKDGGAGTTLYVKQSGSGSTGWAAK